MQPVQGTRENPLPTITSATVFLLPGLAHWQSLGGDQSRTQEMELSMIWSLIRQWLWEDETILRLPAPASVWMWVSLASHGKWCKLKLRKWVRECVRYPRTELQEHPQFGENAGLEGWTITLSLESETQLKAVTKRWKDASRTATHRFHLAKVLLGQWSSAWNPRDQSIKNWAIYFKATHETWTQCCS